MAALLFCGCAQVLPLDGGPKDNSAPKLLKSIPSNATVNFNAKIIEFFFDEYVQIKDINNQLVITPQFKKVPEIEARGKKVTVKFKEDLLPNTTYRLFFGNAVSDMHESNVVNRFEYVFSTGNYIDSLFVEGIVTNIHNLKPQSEIAVGLYLPNDTVASLLKNKPAYFTKTDNIGRYKLTYLPKSEFTIIAFADKNKNLMYDGPEESLAFNSEFVNTGSDTIVNLKMFKEEPAKLFVKKAVSPYYGLAYIIFNKETENQAEALYKSQQSSISTVKSKNDTCLVYYNNIFDTLRLVIKHGELVQNDTVSVALISREKHEKQIKEKKLIFDYEIVGLNSGKLEYFNPLTVLFNNWIDTSSIDRSKVVLSQVSDSILKPIQISLNTASLNKVQLKNKLDPASEYKLVISHGAVRAKSGIENDSLQLSFKTTDPEDYASLTLKLLLPKKENYIIQIVNSEEKVIAEHYTELSIASSAEQSYVFNNLLPGNYFVKVIEDRNKNEKWDTGTILTQKQPELIYFNPIAIKLLANWDSESEWTVK